MQHSCGFTVLETVYFVCLEEAGGGGHVALQEGRAGRQARSNKAESEVTSDTQNPSLHISMRK